MLLDYFVHVVDCYLYNKQKILQSLYCCSTHLFQMAIMKLILFTISCCALLPSGHQAGKSQIKINHPRQVRTNDIDYNLKNPNHTKLNDYVINFMVKFTKSLQDYDQECNVEKHNEWFTSGSKDIQSAEPGFSFVLDHEWRNQICDFFRFLDCVADQSNGTRGICKCVGAGSTPAAVSRYNLKLVHDDADKADHDKEPHKSFIRHKRRCRAAENELCNFVRLPKGTFPEVPLSFPVFLECPRNFECMAKLDGREGSQRCLPKPNKDQHSSVHDTAPNQPRFTFSVLLLIAWLVTQCY